jgi:uncharacterized protein YecE (DUF72 family)
MPFGNVLVGVSGYDYREWRGVFYPQTLPRSAWLRYAETRFDSIELNATFYSLKTPATYERWRSAVSDGFMFAVKGSGYITHRLRLKNPTRAIANFYASGVLALGRHTGPFLWQLPPQMRFEAERLDRFLGALPRDSSEAERLARRHDRRLPSRARLRATEAVRYRHALEVRDASFQAPELVSLLRKHGVSLVVADTGNRFPVFEEPTTDFMYVRLHGPRELYASGYDPRELALWAERVENWRAAGQDVYVYFDNNVRGHAPFDAIELRRLLADPPKPGDPVSRAADRPPSRAAATVQEADGSPASGEDGADGRAGEA